MKLNKGDVVRISSGDLAYEYKFIGRARNYALSVQPFCIFQRVNPSNGCYSFCAAVPIVYHDYSDELSITWEMKCVGMTVDELAPLCSGGGYKWEMMT